MPRQDEELLDDALKLAPARRAELAAALLASLDGPPDADAEAAWGAELERRARRVLDGERRGADWAAVLARLRARRRA